MKPTTKKPQTDLGKRFERDTNAIMHNVGAPNEFLNEVNKMLNEKELSLKRKIFSLPKMEALVHADPKLSVVYDEMAEDARDRYGYHWNETIMNIIFNDYVLNSPKYLQKYKMTKPKEKKRRDQSGIDQLKKELQPDKPEKKDDEKKKVDEDVDRTRVQFLVHPNDPEVFAYFPDEEHSKTGRYKMGYSHIGQHTAVDPQYAAESRPAKPKEYEELKNELEQHVGYNLDIMQENMNEKTNKLNEGWSPNATEPAAGEQMQGAKIVAETQDKPEDDDCFVQSDGWKLSVSCDGKFIGEFTEDEDAWEAVRKWKEDNNFYPNTWFVSDHGNISLVDDRGNIIDESTATAGVGGGYATKFSWAGGPTPTQRRSFWPDGEVIQEGEDKKKEVKNLAKKPFWDGGKLIQEGTYLTNPSVFESYINYLKEVVDTEKLDTILDKYKDMTGDDGTKKPTEKEKDEFEKEYADFLDKLHVKYDDKMLKEKTKKVHERHLNTRDEKVDFILNNMDTPKLEMSLKGLNDDEVDRIYKALEKKLGLTETDQSMIDRGDMSMSNKPQPTGEPGSNLERGMGMTEEAKSKAQQRFMGAVRGVQKGETKPSDVSPEVKKVAKQMKPSDVKDFAATKHDDLPEKVNEDHLEKREDKEKYLVKASKKLFPNISSDSISKFVTMLKDQSDMVIDQMYRNFEKELIQKGFDPIKDVTLTETLNETEWVGTDADLEASLVEYGFVAKQPENKDYPDEWFVIYRISDNAFGTGWIRESELDNIVHGKEWADENDVNSFLSYTGSDKDNWLQQRFVNKLSDLIGYWGHENIMGTDYAPMTKEEALERIQSTELDEIQELSEELNKYNKHKKYLNKIMEDRKPSSLVMKDRLGTENVSNFKKDLQHSGTKEIVDTQKQLQWKDQQTEVTDPKKFSQDIEKDVLKRTEGNALKNVGNSANPKGDEVPKRNLTDEEYDEVRLMRLGLGDYVFENEPDKRFEERMKEQMGEENYKLRQAKMEFRGKAPMYNKDNQPVKDTAVEKVEFNKEKAGWNDRMGKLKEGVIISGKYLNDLGKHSIVDFYLKDVNESKKPQESWKELDFDALGNRYTNNVKLNEGINDMFNDFKFYVDEDLGVHVVRDKKVLNENANNKPQVNEGFEKMKHFMKYNPKKYVSTDSTKLNRGF